MLDFEDFGLILESESSSSSFSIKSRSFYTEANASSEMGMLPKPDMDASTREKNWMAFDIDDGILRFVTSLYPFVVIRRENFNFTSHGYMAEIESSVYEDNIFQVAEATKSMEEAIRYAIQTIHF